MNRTKNELPAHDSRPKNLDLADATRYIRMAEWAVASAPCFENPEADRELVDFFEFGPGHVFKNGDLQYVELAMTTLGDNADNDEEAAETIPDYKRNAVLNGIGIVLDFCQRRPVTMNALFNRALQDAVRKTLVQLLGQWYSLEPGEGGGSDEHS